MDSNTTNLFHEFKAISLAEWQAKIEKDLKGKPLNTLNFKPEFDLDAKAFYHTDEMPGQTYSKLGHLNRDNNNWSITESYVDSNSEKTNQTILAALNAGVTGVKVSLSNDSNCHILFKDVLIEYIFTHVICHSSDQLQNLLAYLKESKQKLSIIEMPFLTQGLSQGTLELNQLTIDDFIEQSAPYCIKNLVIDGHSFCQYGASTAQELGIALSQLNEYIQRLHNQNVNLEFWHEKIAVHLGITDNYFVNIAKFRAIKELVLQLQVQWEMNIETAPWVSAESVVRQMTVNDRENNILRQTSAAMSAVLGGISQLIINPYSQVSGNDAELSTRMARNIQLVLKEEAYFDQVIDPGAGSYAIEVLTDQLIEKAWAYFLTIENEGGYYDAIHNNTIGNMIKESVDHQVQLLNDRTKTLLGVNKFQNPAEEWLSSSLNREVNSIDFKGFEQFNLEQNFENN